MTDFRYIYKAEYRRKEMIKAVFMFVLLVVTLGLVGTWEQEPVVTDTVRVMVCHK